MHFYKKILTLVFLLAFGLVTTFGQSLEDLQNGIQGLSEGFSKTLSFNSTLGLNWSDAFIGKLVDSTPFHFSAPPHFGVGLSLGATSMNLEKLTGDLSSAGLGSTLPNLKVLPIPTGLAELRIGGFFLPFDIGFKVDFIPDIDLELEGGASTKLKYLLLGFDIRYAILEDKFALPAVSVATGLNFLNGGISAGTASISYPFEYKGKQHSIDFYDPEAHFNWDNLTWDFKAQVSKKIAFITPYAGLGASIGWTTIDYGLSSEAHFDAGGNLELVQDYLKEKGLSDISIDRQGISSELKNVDFGMRAFAGLSLNIVVVRLDLTGMFNFLDQSFGGSLGLRFQL
jgi:hypothetical protein